MQLPIIVQQYQLLQQIGAGSFAIVYKSRHIKTKQLYAVKKMKQMQRNHVELVRNQIELMKRLKHKNIIKYQTDFREKGKWYIVLEYCGKGDLEKFKKKVGKIPQNHCKNMIYNIVQALSQLHKNKIVHRDLKLPNILINDQYDLKLADFGFSKDNEEGLMQSFCGTPLSMAPEILKRQKYDEKCDTWSLGVIMYMLLFDKPPYFPTQEHGKGIGGLTNVVTKTKHTFDKKVSISPECVDFINNCLEQNPDKRASIDELKKHPLFTHGIANELRIQFFSESLNEQNEGVQRCKLLLNGVFEDHLKKLVQVSSISEKTLRSLISGLKLYYSNNYSIQKLFLMMAAKKTDQLNEKCCVFELEKVKHCIPLKKLKKFNHHIDCIKTLIIKELDSFTRIEFDKDEADEINIEKQLTKFILDEIHCMLEESQNFNEKRNLFIEMCQFYTKQLDKCELNVTWGMSTELEYLQKSISSYLSNLRQEKLINQINEDASSEEDLESFWLIEHQIEVKNRKGQEIQLGCLFQYILNANELSLP